MGELKELSEKNASSYLELSWKNADPDPTYKKHADRDPIFIKVMNSDPLPLKIK